MAEKQLEEGTYRKLNMLMRVHERYRTRGTTRMETSWKTSLALWTALGAATGVIATGRLPSLTNTQILIGVVCLVVIAFAYVYWICGVARDNNMDGKHVKDLMEKIGPEVGYDPAEPCRHWCWHYYSQLFQGLVTLMLCGLLGLATWAASSATLRASDGPGTQPSGNEAGLANKVENSNG